MSHFPPRPPWPQPAPVPGSRPLHRRKRVWLGAAGLSLLMFSCGAVAGSTGSTDDTGKKTAARPGPTTTVTTTARPTAEPEPRPTVTKTRRVEVKVTVTAQSAEAPPAHDEPESDAGVYYDNCADARAQGAAVRRGDPGYGRHLDRDRDGVGCDWG
jgi:hypothetical protein